MPTGLFRQVLYGRENKQDKATDTITIAVLCFAAVSMLAACLPLVKQLTHKPAYYLAPATYIYILAVFWIADLACFIHPALRKYCHPFNFILVMVMGYFAAEIVFRYSPPALPSSAINIFGVKGWTHLNSFFMHRFLQIIPMGLMVILTMFYRGRLQSYLRIGDLSVKTDILNRNNPQPWSSVLLRFSVYLVLVLGIVTLISFRRLSPDGINTGLFFPIIIYAVWNCLVEETIFRGILFPVFSQSYGEKSGNIVQALLFGIMHLSPVNMEIGRAHV